MRAFQQSRHVDHHERFFVGNANDAQLRLERCERIIGNLGPRRGDHGEQRRLAGIGNADDPGIGEQPQLQAKRKTFAGLAAFGKSRRLANAGGKVLIA